MTGRTRRATLVLAVLAMAWWVPPGAGRAGTAPIPGSEFVARLEAARSLAEAGAANPSPARMDAVRGTLGLPLDVVVPGGTVHVGNDDILNALKGRSADDFRHAGDQLAAMEDAAQAALAAHPPDAARVGAALASAFRGIRTSPTLLERIRHDAWAFVLSIWQRITGATRSLPIPSWLAALIAAGAVLAAAVLVVRRLRYVVPERRAGAAAALQRKPTDWDRLAREALARGDLAGAVRYRYGALLAALAKRGVVPNTPSLTAGEARRAVQGGLPAAYPAVTEATAVFESVAYGGSDATEAGIEALSAAQRQVVAA